VTSGYGDDWKTALEHVKNLYVEPGKQPEMIRDLALEAIKFVDDHDLITVPQMARDTWRMEMMTPSGNWLVRSFWAAKLILVSFPTNTTVARAKNDEHARQQRALRTRYGLSRIDTRTSPAGLHERALPTLSRLSARPSGPREARSTGKCCFGI